MLLFLFYITFASYINKVHCMIWILFTILSATGIFLFFKLIDKHKLSTLNAIVINYLVAAILGFAIADVSLHDLNLLQSSWLLTAIIIGVLFILMFFVLGYSSKVSGMSLTTLAAKMSVVIPMLFSMLYFKEGFTFFKIFGLALALIGLVLAVYKKTSKGTINRQFLVPILLFVGMGMVDALVKYAQETYINNDISALFTASLFSISFLTGVIILLFNLKSFKAFANVKLWLFGIGLGLVNFGSIYFLIRALNSKVFDSSVVFGVNNIGIIVLSAFIGLVWFKEKLSKLNWIGLLICIFAIGILYITK